MSFQLELNLSGAQCLKLIVGKMLSVTMLWPVSEGVFVFMAGVEEAGL